MYKKTIALFGGSGGIGSKLIPLLEENFTVIPISKKIVDITNYNEVEDFFNNNKIDIVINASGINYDGFIHKFDKVNISKIDEQIDVNIKGTINIINCSLKYMRAQGYGRIILFSSILSTMPVISTGIYASCKGFIDTLVKVVSIENLNKGIACNSIQLGYFDGGLTHRIAENFRNTILNDIPLKRWGKIEELYNVINMLIETEYISGTNIKINGGIYV